MWKSSYDVTPPRRFHSEEYLRRLTTSTSSRIRLRALISIRRQIIWRGLKNSYFTMARPLIADRSNKCRWQALIVVGEFVRVDPKRVWQVIKRYGVSPDEDMRSGVACILLEHLLEHHFAEYFPPIRRLALEDP